jgi:hypothetical protein
MVVLILGLLAGCRGDDSTSAVPLDVDLAISPTPPAVGPARLILTLRDSAGAPLNGARVSVEGNMSHAGMVPVRDTAQSSPDPGQYVVPEFTFTMAGDWVLTVRVVLPDGRETQRDLPTNVVGEMGSGR